MHFTTYKKIFYLTICVFLGFVFVAACQSITPQPTSQEPNADPVFTQAAQTAEYQNTRAAELNALATQIEATQLALAVQTVEAKMTQEVQVTPTSTPTPIIPTSKETPTPQIEQIPTAILTELPTSPPIGCDMADFLGDITPGTQLVYYPGEVFRKVIRLQNVGTCTWTPEYSFVMTSGVFQGATLVLMPNYVRPGQTVDLSFPLVAPQQPGNYISYWNMRNATGGLFGIGVNGDIPITIQAVVVPEGSLPSYDFATNYCQANWLTGAGAISCLGGTPEEDGLVNFLQYSVMESGLEPGPGLWVHPNDSPSGWISGRYPPVLIQPYDRFKATVGCASQAIDCSISFQVEFETASGVVDTLGQWRQNYDGRSTMINIDLSPYAGQYLKFILTVAVQNNQQEDAYGIWAYPRIEP